MKTTICNINLKEYSDNITAADCKKHGFDQRNIIKRATLAYNMLHEKESLKDTDNKVLAFIANFFYTAAMRVVHQCRDSIEYSAAWEASNNLYRAGYCYHFANILKATFKRGEVVWLAPFSHCGWQDIDGKVYDAEGYYEGEAFYAIPESYCEDIIIDFSHKDGIPDTKYYSREKLISAVKEYCKKSGETYQPDIENWFRND